MSFRFYNLFADSDLHLRFFLSILPVEVDLLPAEVDLLPVEVESPQAFGMP